MERTTSPRAQKLSWYHSAAMGAHQLTVLNWLAAAGPQPVDAVAARLVAATAASSVPLAVARPLVATLPRVRIVDDRVTVVAPFWWDTPCVIIDLETTGMNPRAGASVTEVAAWRVQGDRVLDRFVRLVDPGHPIPPVVVELTGIDDAMVAGQPSWAQTVPELAAFVGDDPWVAHNLTFDARFIDVELASQGAKPFPGRRVCTLRLARRLLKGGRHGLGALVERLGVEGAPSHRAEADVAATHQVLQALLYRCPMGVDSWEALAGWLGGAGFRRRPVSAPAILASTNHGPNE